MSEWLRTRRDRPCPVCGKPDWCRVSRDGRAAHCMRVEEGGRPWSGESGEGWVHNVEIGQQVDAAEPAYKMDFNDYIHRLWMVHGKYEPQNCVGTMLGPDCELWPERDPFGQIIGVVRRYPSGHKRCVPGSKRGLTLNPDQWLYAGSKNLFVVEGGTDTVALWNYGYYAVGRPSAGGGKRPLEYFFKHNLIKNICFIGENDYRDTNGKCHCRQDRKVCALCWPGQFHAAYMSRYFSCKGYNSRVILPPEQFKDTREWLAGDPAGARKVLDEIQASYRGGDNQNTAAVDEPAAGR